MSRSEQATQARRAAAAAERKRLADRRKRIRAWIIGATSTVVIAAGLVWFAASYNRGFAPPEGAETYTISERSHVQGVVDYPQEPPAGGNHAPVWQNCGFYSEPIIKENGVHTQEHGAVWITYQPGLPADQITAIRGLADQQTYVLATPYPGLDSPIVASVWGVQLRVDSAEDPRLAQFIRVYRLGSQTPESGAPCTGGLGTPS